MDMTKVERRLLGLDDEIHYLLRYISISKERDIGVELENYEDMKETIPMNLKEPILLMRLQYPGNGVKA